MKAHAVHPADPPPARQGAVAMATLLIAFAFAMPPDLVSYSAYAAAMLIALGLYTVFFARDVLRALIFKEYLLFAGLALLYVGLSVFGVIRPAMRLSDPGAVLPQAAGLLLIIAALPAFTHAAGMIFLPRLRIVPFAAIMLAVLLSITFWRDTENILIRGGVYGVRAPALLLHFLYFFVVLRISGNRGIRCLLLLLPLPLSGAASNALIQLALAGLVLAGRPRQVLLALVAGLIALMLGLTYFLDTLRGIGLADPNVGIRSILWRHAVESVATHPLGIGYGSGWTDFQALRDPGIRHLYAFNLSRSLQIANHSSFLDLPLRLGWLSLLLFALMLRRLWRDCAQRPFALEATAALFIVLVAAAFNPVIESARSALFVALALGYMRATAMFAPENAARAGKPLPDAFVPAISPRERRVALAAQNGGAIL
ncbi:O-antigen ligase family protein [Tsuneonella sp. CC-YZS046]|jgi:hypothetical protein|uniref:O-antigen ligase family protein n=1 Tax=Tsuneonella sp. CC-YZS046 TaxID=3042152 RepID=UPI002D7905FB|nr:O-antigen ligase family protein [Tsuneonella sp. CC-YZS046]WRO66324.1 O-antigen ligase family protein [Tsuneonella sp. CC-YZS046]